jgi:hypothetical protein
VPYPAENHREDEREQGAREAEARATEAEIQVVPEPRREGDVPPLPNSVTERETYGRSKFAGVLKPRRRATPIARSLYPEKSA